MTNTGRLILATLLIVSLNAVAHAQNIVEAARQERARQKEFHGTTVFTNESIKELSPTKETAAAPPAETAKEATADVQRDNKGRDEKYWRETFANARQDLKRAEDSAAVQQLKLNELLKEFYQQGDKYNKENQLGPEITAAKSQYDDARQQVSAAQQKISDLEEELRKSGGPPGWAR